jgi:hypothetical protein
MARCVNMTCAITTVDSATDSGGFSSIALDNGIPVISYFDWANAVLKLARCNSIVCDAPMLRTLDSSSNVGQGISLEIDNGGIPVIAYRQLTRCTKYLSINPREG